MRRFTISQDILSHKVMPKNNVENLYKYCHNKENVDRLPAAQSPHLGVIKQCMRRYFRAAASAKSR
jgi:hypothetical protein